MKEKRTSLAIITIMSFILFCIGYSAIAQAIDSTAVQQVISTGVTIISANNTIIKGVPNEITGSLITLIAGFIIRLIEKRRLRKQGKLIN
jgi:NADH:ubiquinone oxidoreductase subunit K